MAVPSSRVNMARTKLPNLLTLAEVSEVLRVSDSAVRRCICDLGLPVVRVCNRLMVRDDDLLLFIEAATDSNVKAPGSKANVVTISTVASA